MARMKRPACASRTVEQKPDKSQQTRQAQQVDKFENTRKRQKTPESSEKAPPGDKYSMNEVDESSSYKQGKNADLEVCQMQIDDPVRQLFEKSKFQKAVQATLQLLRPDAGCPYLLTPAAIDCLQEAAETTIRDYLSLLHSAARQQGAPR
ncbi:unnamed protein product [Symbiodinium sp. CCMP2592]|nr:unnamed protein product [Symbiodinium sp. CCMP2592]